MKLIRSASLVLVLCSLLLAATASAKPEVEIPLRGDCNLFELGSPVAFDLVVKDFPQGRAKVDITLSNFWGDTKPMQTTLEVDSKKLSMPIDLGQLPAGYFEMTVKVSSGSVSQEAECSFGVVRFNDLTPEEVHNSDLRFGLKMWGPTPYFDSYKAMDAAARMGLHWTRERFNKNIDELDALPVKIIYKVEMFPEEAYDEERYGPKDEFKHRHLGWNKATVPLEGPYKEWLTEEIAKLPKDHYVFEIWNEAWGRLPPEDFAQVCQWTKDVIRAQRPDAKVGPNLGTHREYDAEFIAAGGMEGMDILVLHPYGHPERHHVRAKLHGVHDFYESQLGRPIDFYVTEYGSPTPPAGPRSNVSEELVAALNVRRSLVFYVEDVKGFMPHVLGQSEKDPEDKEDWYGHFRKNMQPKPQLITLGNAARLVDGSRYVGDLFIKPDVGAYLFERDGVYTLVLWTNDNHGWEEPEENKIDVQLDLGVETLTKVDIVGKEQPIRTNSGKLDLTLDGNVIYLVGVSPDLEKYAYTQPRTDQWVTGIFERKERTTRRLPAAPVIDGKITEKEWGSQPVITMEHSKVDNADISGTAYVSWDAQYLYVAVDIKDDEPFIKGEEADELWSKKLHNPYSAKPYDGFEVRVGSQPKYQIPEFLFAHDRDLFFSSVKEDGELVAGNVNLVTKKLEPIPGLKYQLVETPDGWSAELAIPLAYFKDFPTEPDARIAFEVTLIDADTDKKGVRIIHPKDAGRGYFDDATRWSYLRMQEQ